nr:trigger factor-like isoform X5 [Pocillopora verrucosa]
MFKRPRTFIDVIFICFASLCSLVIWRRFRNENQASTDESVCRVYEVGRLRRADDEDEQESDEGGEEDDYVDDDDDENDDDDDEDDDDDDEIEITISGDDDSDDDSDIAIF